MKYPTLATALLLVGTAPAAAAMTIDPEERELYDDSIRCAVLLGLKAGLGGDRPADPKIVESGNKFLMIAAVIADNDREQLDGDFAAQREAFDRMIASADNPKVVQQLRDMDAHCAAMESRIDAHAEGGD